MARLFVVWHQNTSLHVFSFYAPNRGFFPIHFSSHLTQGLIRLELIDFSKMILKELTAHWRLSDTGERWSVWEGSRVKRKVKNTPVCLLDLIN